MLSKVLPTLWAGSDEVGGGKGERLDAGGGFLQNPAHHVEAHLRRLELDHRARTVEQERADPSHTGGG